MENNIKHIIPDHHPAIVSKELFDKAAQPLVRFSLPNKKTHEYLLKGKVFCGCCDHSLSRIIPSATACASST